MPTLSGNVGVVYNQLIGAGYSPIQAAGMVGRLQQESGMDLNPAKPGDAGKSWGIAQWNGERLAQLKQMFPDSWQDPTNQAKFIIHELGTTEKRAGDLLRNANTIEDAAKAAMGYERPQGFTWGNPTSGSGYNNTIRYANSIAGSGGVVTGPNVGQGTTLTSIPLNPAATSPTGASPSEVSAATPAAADAKPKTGIDALNAQLSDEKSGLNSGLADISKGMKPAVAAAPAADTIAPMAADPNQANIRSQASQIMAQLMQKRNQIPGLTLGMA